MTLMEALAEAVCSEDEVLERLKFWKEEGVRWVEKQHSCFVKASFALIF
jgi:hypothetical protein